MTNPYLNQNNVPIIDFLERGEVIARIGTVNGKWVLQNTGYTDGKLLEQALGWTKQTYPDVLILGKDLRKQYQERVSGQIST